MKRLIWLGIVLMVVGEVLVGGCSSERKDISTAAAIMAGARREVSNRTVYVDGWYEGGYPPDGVGVCTDVIWRAFREAGYNLKEMVDKDIRENRKEYPKIEIPDPNIDFRRVVNLKVFFQRHAQTLTLEIISNNTANLQEWQGGDLVIFGYEPPNTHIAVVSDRRNGDGVPYLIHNAGYNAKEEDALLYWAQYTITGHYRWQQ